ncbi:MAG TPA: DUF2333 family protein [Gammaproteobacteria bacterium]|nr:DUF2333 family protein [Gammaproteobacteria bacterium]
MSWLRDWLPEQVPWRWIGSGLVVLLVIGCGFGWYWSREPALDQVRLDARERPFVTGYATVESTIRTCGWLLDKPGGYLSNDLMPPGVWLDNMPSFEFGVLEQCRDVARVLRDRFSRSQSQSTEDADLAIAQPAFNFSSDSWIFPATESKIREGLDALRAYQDRISNADEPEAQFFARADNLNEWLSVVELRLGSLSQRLSASVERTRVNTDLAGEPSAANSTRRSQLVEVRTPWLQIDNVFYEARGSAWALLQFLRAIERDFSGVLEDKNATVSIAQIERELEGALGNLFSPIILNGSGFGLFANHSLVLASYISRAHSAIIDVRDLLEQG